MDPVSGALFYASTIGFAGLDAFLNFEVLFFRRNYVTDSEWAKMSKAEKDAFWKAHINDVKNLEKTAIDKFLRLKRMKATADALKLEKARNARRNAAFNARLKGFMEYMATGGKATKKLIEILEEGNLAYNSQIKKFYDTLLKTSEKVVHNASIQKDFEEALKKGHTTAKNLAEYQAKGLKGAIEINKARSEKVRADFVKKLAAQIAEEEEMRAAKAEAQGAKKIVEEVKKASSAWCRAKVFFESAAGIYRLFCMVSIGTFIFGILGFVATILIEAVVLEIAWKFGEVLGAYLRDEKRLKKAQMALDEKMLFLGDKDTYLTLELRDLKAEEELNSEAESEPLVCALLTKFIGFLTEDVNERTGLSADIRAANSNAIIARVPKDVRKLYATAYVAGRYEVFALFINRNASRQSKCLARIVYDKREETMYLNFTDGSWYAYYSVSANEVLRFIKAAQTDLGAYFNYHIRPYHKAYSRGKEPPVGLHSEYMINSKTGSTLYRLNDGTYAGKVQIKRFGYWKYLTQEYIDENGETQFIVVRQWVGNV